MEFDTFILICNYIGTIAFAASGAIKGFDKKLDTFGITLLVIFHLLYLIQVLFICQL